MPLPRDNPGRQATASLALHGRPSTDPAHPPAAVRHAQLAIWDEATRLRFQMAYQRLRRTFTRLGVAVVCAATDEPVPLILSRLERLRTPGRPPR